MSAITKIAPVPAKAIPASVVTPEIPNDNEPQEGKASRRPAYLDYDEDELRFKLYQLVNDPKRWARRHLDVKKRIDKMYKSFLDNNLPVPPFLEEIFLVCELLSDDQEAPRIDPLPATTPSSAGSSRANTKAAAPQRTSAVRSSGDAQDPSAARPSPQTTKPHVTKTSRMRAIPANKTRGKKSKKSTSKADPLGEISDEALLECHTNIMKLAPTMGYAKAAEFIYQEGLAQLEADKAAYRKMKEEEKALSEMLASFEAELALRGIDLDDVVDDDD